MTHRVVLAAVGESGSKHPIIADGLIHSSGEMVWTRCDAGALELLTRALAVMPRMATAAAGLEEKSDGEVGL